MKKSMIIFILLILLIPAFAMSNGKKDAEAEFIVLNVMAYGDNSNQEGVNWKRIVDSFEKENPGITLKYELLYDQAYHQKVGARLASGDIPDIAYMGADALWGTPWKEAGQQWDHRGDLNSMYDMNLIPAHGPNGEIYEIPLGTSNITTVLFMNEKLVKSLGFSAPKTYEDLVAMVPVAKEAGIEVVTIDGADGWAWGSCVLSSFIARTSGDPNWVSKAVEGEYKFTDEAFVNALGIIEQMVKDGVISKKVVQVDYGTNISNYNSEKALFMIQGQWASGGIENKEVADNTVLMPFPKLPGEKGTAGSVATALTVGYGLTKNGAMDEGKKKAGLKFIDYFNSTVEVTQRLRDGTIIAPVLKGFEVPNDLPEIVKSKIKLAQTASGSEVIDAFLTGAPNDALNAGMQEIVIGQATPQEIATKVESLLRN